MGMSNGLPKGIYYGSFTPDKPLNQITVDTHLSLGVNGSFVVGIITHDLQYGVPDQFSSASVPHAIIDYMGQGSADYANSHRYIGVKPNGSNDYYTNGQLSFTDGVLTISNLYGKFMPNCTYHVIVMV